MNRLILRICAILLVVSIFTASIPVLAQDAVGVGISSSHTALEISLAPGQNLERIVTIGSKSGAELLLEVTGLTQTLQGLTDVLPLAEDTGTFTARPFINLDKTSLNLAADSSQDIKVFVNIPPGTAPGEKYALIYIHTQPGQSMVITGISINVIVNVTGYLPSRSGTITDLSVSNNYTGQAIDFNTTFANSGNCRISGASNLVVVKDGSGVEKWRQATPINVPSLLPGIPRKIAARYNVGLPGGNYSVKSDITLEAGVLLATQIFNFTVIDPPPVPAAPALLSPGNSTAPGPVVDTLTPTFQWNSLANADYYTLTVTRYPYGVEDKVYISDPLIGTSFSLPSGYLFGGQKYAWVLKATNNISGTGEVSQQFYFQSSGASLPPAVTTDAATNITDTWVTLNGNLTALGTATNVTVYFEIGTSANYGKVIDVSAMTATGAFSANINDLLANTTYYYRTKALGSTAVYGSNMTFKTLAPIPTPSPTLTPSPSPVTSTLTTSTPATTTPTPAGSPASTIAGSTANYLLDGMDPASLVVFAFDEQANFCSAINEAGIEVLLSDFDGQGVIALARYLRETGLDSAFSAPIIKGGTGKPSIKFVDVFVEGLSQGTATVTVYFTEYEIQGFNSDSLFLAYYFSGKWHRCGNINVSADGLAVTGDIPVSRLTGTVVGLGGSLKNEISAGFPPINDSQPIPDTGIPWSLAGIMIGTAIIIGGIIFVVDRKRKNDPATN